MEKYDQIIHHYEHCLEQYGDTHKGVDWPNAEDVNKRYRVMLELQKFDPQPNLINPTVLDFGCGTAHMLEFMNQSDFNNWS